MILLPVLALIPTLQQGAVLDTFQIEGKPVQAMLPSWGSPWSDSAKDFADWQYRGTPAGDLSSRHKGQNCWDELRLLYGSKAASPIAEWRTKIVLFTYGDILDKGPDGVLRIRRSEFFGPDRSAVLHEIALFGSMIEAYSGGRLKFVPDVQEEEQAMRFEVPGKAPFGEEFAKRYFTPRINEGGFQPDDNVYRGPYNSIFFLHDGLSDETCTTQVFGMPVSGLPFYEDYDDANPGQLARRMFNAWYAQLIELSDRQGYQLGPITTLPETADESAPSPVLGDGLPVRIRLPQGLITDSMWAVLANMADSKDYALHGPPADSGPQPWSKVSQSPWTLLPCLDLGKLTDKPGEAAAASADTPVVEIGSYACVEPEFADFAAHLIASNGDVPTAGFVQTSAGPKIVFQTPAGASLRLTSAQAAQVPSELTSKSAGPAPRVAGYFICKAVGDADQGKATLVEENWVCRSGWVRLLGSGEPTAPLPADGPRYLDVLIKPVSGSHAILVVGTRGRASYELFGSPPQPTESASPSPPEQLSLDPNGGWQHAIVDTNGLGEIIGVYLTAGNARFYQVDIEHKASILVASAKLTSSGTPTAPAQPEIASSGGTPEEKSLFAAETDRNNFPQRKTEILKLLHDPSSQVQLNAANVFTRIKDKSAETPLADMVKHLDPRVAERAMRALLAQGTDTGRGPLLTALQNGPFEANKYFAGLLLSGQKDPFLAEPYSLLIDSKDWQLRLLAVQAIAEMPGPTAQKYLLGMLLDTNPEIEAAVAQTGDPSNPDFEKRMQWYAVNDSSDWMRALANIAMIRSPIADFPPEGFKGLKDDSAEVRILILQYLAKHPTESARPSVLHALEDGNPEVRAEALRALSVLSPANSEELNHVVMDSDPRVQEALIDLARSEKLKLSPEVLDRLKKSADPKVKENANSIGG